MSMAMETKHGKVCILQLVPLEDVKQTLQKTNVAKRCK